MTPSRSDDVLIARLLALPVAERATALARALADDPALRDRQAEISAGLAATLDFPSDVSVEPTSPDAMVSVLQSALEAPPTEESGARIGSYKLLEKLGEGGFGTVWMAEQLEPIRRHVAVKIIKAGMDTEEVIARFEVERQALALMEHPNIARVIDAGATDSGRPYFVMELVRGVAITRYCDENCLPAEARLRLFMTVCGAVQHAHQKGVIHRDLKPSNILVTLHDGVPVPKIIDFGIAKATSARLTDKTLFTQLHAFIGTPTYTSPEQLEMSGLDIDTRSDIYSLGVLLYELLTGRPPFDSETLMKSGLEAMRRIIREVDPPRPSTRLDTLSSADRTSLARQRGTDSSKLALLLRGDLDWIVMRCLEKDRTRRYDTSAALAADVLRHLANEPVTARPPSNSYRLQKFYGRHRFGVLAAAAVTAALVAGLIASGVLLVRERAAHRRASAAEQAEGNLRQQAENARGEEVKRAARTALDLANRSLADGRIGEGLAYLVYAARKDPANPAFAPRLASALTSHNFLLPVGEPFAGGSRVVAAHYARDGRTVLCGTEDGTFRLLDAATGELRCEFHLGRPVNPDSWLFADDNDTVVGVRFPDNTLGVYGLPSGQPKFTPVPLDARVWATVENIGLNRTVGLSPDGRWLYAFNPGQFWVWNAATGQLCLNPICAEGVFGAAFSPDSDRIAVAVGNSVKQWRLPEGTPVATVIAFRDEQPRNAFEFASVRYSPDGRLLAVCDLIGQVFDAVTGARLLTLSTTADQISRSSLAFANSHRVFAKLQRRSVVWDLTTGQGTTLAIPAGSNLLTVEFDAAGQRGLATSTDGLTRVFNLETGALVAEPTRPQRAGFCTALSPDGTQIVLGTDSGLIHRLRIGPGAARPLVLPKTPSLHLPAPFLPEAPARLLWLTASNAKVIEVASGADLAGGFAYPEPILGATSDPRFPPVRSDLKYMVVRTQRGEWQAWELDRDAVRQAVVLADPPPHPGNVSFSPGGDLVAIATESYLRVWNLRTGLPAGPVFTYPETINNSTPNFSPDGKQIALSTSHGAALVLDVATSRPVARFPTRPLVPNSIVLFNHDGTRVVTINVRNEMLLWDRATHTAVRPAVNSLGWGDHARFSASDRWLASWGRDHVNLWDGRTGASAGPIIPAGGVIVNFSPDGNRLATSDLAGNAQVWDLPGGEAATEPLSHQPFPALLPEFSPDGRFLKTQNSRIYLWSIPAHPAADPAPPEWLLQLATVCSSQVVNEAGVLTEATEAIARFAALRGEIAALPADAPYAEWGRWILDESDHRSIAPGFTITPAEAARLAARFAEAAKAQP